MFGDSTSVHCARTNATLESAAADCRHIVTTDVNLVTPHEAPDFQVQSEGLAHAIGVDTDGGYQALC